MPKAEQKGLTTEEKEKLLSKLEDRAGVSGSQDGRAIWLFLKI